MKRALQQCIACRMSYHPHGDTVEIVGVNSPTNGRSCEEHHISTFFPRSLIVYLVPNALDELLSPTTNSGRIHPSFGYVIDEMFIVAVIYNIVGVTPISCGELLRRRSNHGFL